MHKVRIGVGYVPSLLTASDVLEWIVMSNMKPSSLLFSSYFSSTRYSIYKLSVCMGTRGCVVTCAPAVLEAGIVFGDVCLPVRVRASVCLSGLATLNHGTFNH